MHFSWHFLKFLKLWCFDVFQNLVLFALFLHLIHLSNLIFGILAFKFFCVNFQFSVFLSFVVFLSFNFAIFSYLNCFGFMVFLTLIFWHFWHFWHFWTFHIVKMRQRGCVSYKRGSNIVLGLQKNWWEAKRDWLSYWVTDTMGSWDAHASKNVRKGVKGG